RSMGLALMESGGDAPERAFRTFLALKKIAFFDIALMVDALICQRERVIRAQQEAIRELSTPVLKVRQGLLLLPLIGAIDSERAAQFTSEVLRAIRIHRARVVVLDVTGVAGMDTRVAHHVLQAVDAMRLMGATAILSGLAPEVAQTLVTI